MKDAFQSLNEKIEFLIIGEKATSYKLPLIVNEIKEYDGKICVETKNIRNMYIVFDKTTFLEAVKNINTSTGEKNGNIKK